MMNLTAMWRFSLRAALALVLLGATSAIGASRVSAETPTPSATPPVTPNPTPAKGLSLVGTVWIDAAPAPEGTVVQALADSVVCGEGTVARGRPALPALSFKMDVPAAAEKAACAKAGATVSFTINGKPAHQTLKLDAAALAAAEPQSIDLSAGEPFAAYGGSMAIQGEPVTEFLIDGKPLASPIIIDASIITPNTVPSWHKCAEVVIGQEGLSTAAAASYSYLVVPPASLKEGCGTEGARVGFRIAGGVVAETTWTPGFHRLDLKTDGPMIYAPTTGDTPGTGGASHPMLPATGLMEEQEPAESTALWWGVVGVGGVVAMASAIGLGASLVRSRRRGSSA